MYISDDMNGRDRQEAIDIASAFIDDEKPVAKTAVLIPVAAHQDSEYILPTLAAYAAQRGAEPFTVFLYLNAPLVSSGSDAVADAEQAVDTSRELFPHLDVRSGATRYYADATIGMIRRDLWNAVFLLADHEHGFSSDVIGINNDIDTHRISPHYIARIQQHYERRNHTISKHLGRSIAERAVQVPAATRVTHTVLPSHPNVGRVTTWVDNTYFQAPGHVGYEAGLVVPLSSYAYHSGFSAEAKTHETARVQGGGTMPFIGGAHLYTSPRRYIDRLHEHDTSAIWTEDSFGTNDACRDVLVGDISVSRADEVIVQRLNEDIEQYWLSAAMKDIYDEMGMMNFAERQDAMDGLVPLAAKRVEKQVHKADRLLRYVIGSAALANSVRSRYVPTSYAESRVESLHYFLRDFGVRG